MKKGVLKAIRFRFAKCSPRRWGSNELSFIKIRWINVKNEQFQHHHVMLCWVHLVCSLDVFVVLEMQHTQTHKHTLEYNLCISDSSRCLWWSPRVPLVPLLHFLCLQLLLLSSASESSCCFYSCCFSCSSCLWFWCCSNRFLFQIDTMFKITRIMIIWLWGQDTRVWGLTLRIGAPSCVRIHRFVRLYIKLFNCGKTKP